MPPISIIGISTQSKPQPDHKMRTSLVFGIIAATLPSAFAADQPSTPAPQPAERPAAKTEKKQAPPSIPDDIRKQYSAFAGKALAFAIQQRFKAMSSEKQKMLIDADIVKKAFMDNLAQPLDEESLKKEGDLITKAYEEAYKAYSKAKTALFFQENAKKPGVILLENGMQCEVTVDKDPANNYRIEEADNVEISTLHSDFAMRSRMSSSGVLEDFVELSEVSRELLKELPEGTKWIVYVPASALSETFREDDEQCLILTFDRELKTRGEEDGRDEDIEDEE